MQQRHSRLALRRSVARDVSTLSVIEGIDCWYCQYVVMDVVANGGGRAGGFPRRMEQIWR